MENEITQIKRLRKQIAEQVAEIKNMQGSRARALAITNLEQGGMWLGKALQELGTPDPYPHSRNPENTIIEPPAEEIRKQIHTDPPTTK